MSRAYRIRVSASESIEREITASDEICSELELIEVLPAEQMTELLKKSLQNHGFEDRDGKMERTQNGVTVTVDPETAEIGVRIEATENVQATRTKEVWIDDPTTHAQNQARERLRETLQKELEKAIDPKEGVLQQRVSAELEAQLGDLNEELSQVSNEVTREALKKKAQSMGQIKNLTEDPQAGTLTIQIEV
jgi:type III secretory pathway lipoprotein EscJ